MRKQEIIDNITRYVNKIDDCSYSTGYDKAMNNVVSHNISASKLNETLDDLKTFLENNIKDSKESTDN